MAVYFTKEAAVNANRIATSEYGQLHVVQQEANLDYALGRVEKYAEDSKSEDDKVLRKAAFLLRYLAYQGHIFADGNKRTAFTLAKAFLELNGFELPYISDEADAARAKMMKEIAQGNHSLSHVFKWLKKSAKKRE